MRWGEGRGGVEGQGIQMRRDNGRSFAPPPIRANAKRLFRLFAILQDNDYEVHSICRHVTGPRIYR